VSAEYIPALEMEKREHRNTAARLAKAEERIEELLAQRAYIPEEPDANELRNHVSRLRTDLAHAQAEAERQSELLHEEYRDKARVMAERDAAQREIRSFADRARLSYETPAPVVVSCSCPRPDDGRSPVEIGLEILRAAGVPSQDQTDLLEPYLSGRVSAVELAISYLERRPAVALDKTDAIELVKDLEKRVSDAATAKKGAKDAATKRVKYARDALVARLTRKGATETDDEDELEETADGITYLHGKKPETGMDIVNRAHTTLATVAEGMRQGLPSGPPPIPEGYQR